MSTLRYIAIHHSGGLQADPLASTRYVTPEQINAHHKARWNFESKFIANSFGGYNFGYSPITRKFHQFRALGEETAAQLGYNFDTISICIFGNYSKLGTKAITADPMTELMEKDIARFVLDLISGKSRKDFVTAPNTKFDLALERVHPHRWFQPTTECYGTGLSNSWIQNLLAKYKVTPDSDQLEQRVALIRQIMLLYIKLLSMQEKVSATGDLRISSFDRGDCPESLPAI